MIKRKEIYQKLSKLDLGPYMEKKKGLSYISWAVAVHILQSIFDEVTYDVVPAPDGSLIHFASPNPEAGAMVVVELCIEGHKHTEYFPVMDPRMETAPLQAREKVYKQGKPEEYARTIEAMGSRDVSDSIKRAFVKAAAHFGLGLSMWHKKPMPPCDKVERGLMPATERMQQTKDRISAGFESVAELTEFSRKLLKDEIDAFSGQLKSIHAKLKSKEQACQKLQ